MIAHDLGVDARSLTRRFGSVEAVRGLSLSAPYGEVTALVGPNGAGKTTLLLMLATLLAPSSGHVRVAGLDPVEDPVGVRARMGWMPDAFGVYDQLTVWEYLKFFADAYRLPEKTGRVRVAETLGVTHLEDYAARPVHVLGRGQNQRLALGRAMLHDPAVLLLDEPASGLDPRSRIELRDVLRGLAAKGAAVLVSSHILTELEEIADRVVFITGGRDAEQHDMRVLVRASAVTWRVRALDEEVLRAALQRRGWSARCRRRCRRCWPAVSPRRCCRTSWWPRSPWARCSPSGWPCRCPAAAPTATGRTGSGGCSRRTRSWCWPTRHPGRR